jgi:hypothetical protein
LTEMMGDAVLRMRPRHVFVMDFHAEVFEPAFYIARLCPQRREFVRVISAV